MLEQQYRAYSFICHEAERLTRQMVRDLQPTPDDLIWAVQFAYEAGLSPNDIVMALREGEYKGIQHSEDFVLSRDTHKTHDG